MNDPGSEAIEDVAVRERLAANPAAALEEVHARLKTGTVETTRRTSLRKPRRESRSAYILHAEKWR